MKLRLLAAALAALTLTAGVASAQDTNTDKGKLSYALGYRYGKQLAGTGETLDINTVAKALQDAYANKEPAVPVEQLQSALTSMGQRMQVKEKAAFDKAVVENKAKSDAFLAQNKTKPGVKTLPSGTQYRVIEQGNGAKPTLSSTVQVEFSGPFPMGEHPQTAPQAQKPPAMKVSQIELPAMREVLLQMPVGSKWEITIPSLWGADMATGMPPNVAGSYEVKLLSVK